MEKMRLNVERARMVAEDYRARWRWRERAGAHNCTFREVKARCLIIWDIVRDLAENIERDSNDPWKAVGDAIEQKRRECALVLGSDHV